MTCLVKWDTCNLGYFCTDNDTFKGRLLSLAKQNNKRPPESDNISVCPKNQKGIKSA